MDGKPILCLDFDGVIHSYSSGWKGADVIPDPPVQGALGFMIEARHRFEIHIFSSRSHQRGGISAMRRWLSDHFAGMGLADHHVAEMMLTLKFPIEKPSALVTIDDRAIQFTGIFPTLEEIAQFKPWNKRKIEIDEKTPEAVIEALRLWYERTEYDEKKARLGATAIEELRRYLIDLKKRLN